MQDIGQSQASNQTVPIAASSTEDIGQSQASNQTVPIAAYPPKEDNGQFEEPDWFIDVVPAVLPEQLQPQISLDLQASIDKPIDQVAFGQSNSTPQHHYSTHFQLQTDLDQTPNLQSGVQVANITPSNKKARSNKKQKKSRQTIPDFNQNVQIRTTTPLDNLPLEHQTIPYACQNISDACQNVQIKTEKSDEPPDLGQDTDQLEQAETLTPDAVTKEEPCPEAANVKQEPIDDDVEYQIQSPDPDLDVTNPDLGQNWTGRSFFRWKSLMQRRDELVTFLYKL